MGPVLEPRPSGSQGVGGCVFRNCTRGVQRLLELELYSPKEREGFLSQSLFEAYLSLSSQAGLRIKMRSQEERGGAGRSKEEPGGARWSQKEPRRTQEEPGEETGGASGRLVEPPVQTC